MIAQERYRRMSELDGWDQERLAHARVLLLGCGAVGSSAALMLAQSGVGELWLCDMDTVEEANLLRSPVLSLTPEAAGKPKALVTAEALRRANPLVRTAALIRPLEELGRGFYGACDIVLCATDSLETRIRVSRDASAAGRPWVNCGMDGYDAEAALHGASSCYECRVAGNPAVRALSNRRFPCAGGLRSKISKPRTGGSVPPIVAMTASMAAWEIVRHLLGHDAFERPIGRYFGWLGELSRSIGATGNGCWSCLERQMSMAPCWTSDITPGATATEAFDWLRLRGEQGPLKLRIPRWIATARCTECAGEKVAIERPAIQLYVDDVLEKACATGQHTKSLQIETIETIAEREPLAGRPLRELGVPDWERLRWQGPARSGWLELRPPPWTRLERKVETVPLARSLEE